ncbi:hypothetical protein AOQ84DRAFT_361981 [Glonium stellatum]|uniref:Uncharacterized protein n=1 Tax=Glonium stellatum TaxID=574774 RepID=A0A8E2F5H3_9PEZI|nr:hypothetical protein AOQ84DRAFT_361981 [Glonium stellatum]
MSAGAKEGLSWQATGGCGNPCATNARNASFADDMEPFTKMIYDGMQGLVDIASEERERRREVESRIESQARQFRDLQIANEKLQDRYAEVLREKENLEERLYKATSGRSNVSNEVPRNIQSTRRKSLTVAGERPFHTQPLSYLGVPRVNNLSEQFPESNRSTSYRSARNSKTTLKSPVDRVQKCIQNNGGGIQEKPGSRRKSFPSKIPLSPSLPASIRKPPEAEYYISSRLFSQACTPSRAGSDAKRTYSSSLERQISRSGTPHQLPRSVSFSTDFLDPSLRDKSDKAPEYVCLIKVMKPERGTFHLSLPSILPSTVHNSVESLLRSWVIRIGELTYPYKQSINCINPLLDKQGIRGTLSRHGGKYAACRLCTETARPCVRVLPDVREKAKAGDMIIVLLPLTEELRHKKVENDQGYWLWKGGETIEELWE